MSRLRSCVLLTLIVAGSAGLPGSLLGQDAAAAGTPIGAATLGVEAPRDVASGATTTAALPLGARTAPLFPVRDVTSAEPTPPLQNRGSVGSDVALMAVGGAALVIGLVIGGDAGTIVAIAGGAMGLVGLCRYLR